MYLNGNNVYNWAKSEYLSTGGSRCMPEKEVNYLDLAKYK